jgi:exodeoxyribonuclease VII large subunit
VACAIFECYAQFISAIGHGIDITIADIVADVKAPTPTATKIVAPNLEELRASLNILESRMIRALGHLLSEWRIS